MIYRKLGNSGIDISIVSFGAMRWLSEESCFEIMQRGMDMGINYVDTSTGYVGGKSEEWTGKAVKNRRSDIYFSSKSHFSQAPSATEVRKAIEGSLKKTGLDYFDFYQLWGLGSMDVLNSALEKGGTISGIHKAMEEGLIKYGPGFTFHGPDEVFKAAVDTGEFMSATISYNIMSRDKEELIDYAADNGVGVIIMNPVAGGVLAMADAPEYDFLKRNGYGSWYGALRFLFANRNIDSSLMGLTEPEQLEMNLKALDREEELDESYRQQMAEMMDRVKQNEGNFCTGCGYCKVCPHDFDPSRFMQFMRDYTIYGVREENLKNWLLSKYLHIGKPSERLAKCVECGQCQEKCPQKLDIVDTIRKSKSVFSINTNQ